MDGLGGCDQTCNGAMDPSCLGDEVIFEPLLAPPQLHPPQDSPSDVTALLSLVDDVFSDSNFPPDFFLDQALSDSSLSSDLLLSQMSPNEVSGQSHNPVHAEAWHGVVPGCQSKGRRLEGSSASSCTSPGVEAQVNGVVMASNESPSAKVGSQAFNYIETSAVLETYGIATSPDLSDALCALPKGAIGSECYAADLPKASDLCGTAFIHASSGTNKQTQNKDKYQGTTQITLHTEDLRGKGVGEGHVTPPGTPKKRRRKRKKPGGTSGELKKERLYEQGPRNNAAEERKRKDAIRAKLCRDRNRKKVQELEEELTKARKEIDGLTLELARRRTFEANLLHYLETEHGLRVPPYSNTV